MNLIDPRFTAPIPSTARFTVPFTPKSLDPARLRREQEAHLDRDSADIEKDADALADQPISDTDSDALASRESGFLAIENRREANAQARKDLDKAHKELAGRVVSVPTFQLRVPTPLDRDMLESRLIGMGVQAIGQEMLRATMIEALWSVDWSNGQTGWTREQNDQVAADNADFLDGLWQIEQAHDKALSMWQEQEAERILDEWNGAPKREGERKPPRLVSPRDGARQILLMDRMMQTPAMRKISATQVDYERRHKMLLVRLMLVSVSGIPNYSTPALLDDALWEGEEIETMRKAMDVAYSAQLASLAWEELVDRIARTYALEEFEAKNFDSPLENTTDQNSSVGPSGEQATSDGNSKASSTSPTPVAAYDPTTGMLLSDIFVSEGTMVPPNSGPTDADTSTSPSS